MRSIHYSGPTSITFAELTRILPYIPRRKTVDTTPRAGRIKRYDIEYVYCALCTPQAMVKFDYQEIKSHMDLLHVNDFDGSCCAWPGCGFQGTETLDEFIHHCAYEHFDILHSMDEGRLFGLYAHEVRTSKRATKFRPQ